MPAVSERRWQAVAIAAGGALGTLARYGVDRGVSGPALGFAWATFVVNVAGSLILGPGHRRHRALATNPLRPAVRGHRLLWRVHHLLDPGGRGGPARPARTVLLAAAYLLASVVAGLAAAAVGIGLARRRFHCGPRAIRSPIPTTSAS